MGRDAGSQLSLEERVARLEGALGWEGGVSYFTPFYFCLSVCFSAASATLAYWGLGIPNHSYQGILAALALLFAYHRYVLKWPAHWAQWVVAFLNWANLSILFKVIIGGGERHPFYWLKYPEILAKKAGDKWYKVVPDWSISWQPTELALWNIDLTIVQSFLVLLIVLGAVFGFQLFVSLLAFFLVLVSIPVLASFDWAWVFPALVLSAISFYLQLPDARFHSKSV